MGTNYEYMIVGVYDDYSGLGRRSVNLESSSFKTLDGVRIDDLNITKTSISFSSKKENEFINILETNLYDGSSLISTTQDLNANFINLLSNHNYVIEIVYNYPSINLLRSSKLIVEVKTLEKLSPSAEIVVTKITDKELTYSTLITDIDNTIVKKEVSLIKNEKVLQINVDDSFSFSNLLSDNDYTIRLDYSYNLNDGSSIYNDYVFVKTHTLKTVIPTIIIKDQIVTTTSISFDYDVSGGVIPNIVSVELKHNDQTVKSLTNIDDLIFDNLLSDNEYVIKIKYEYDLNDGLGFKTYSQEFITRTKANEIPSLYISTSTSSNTISIKELFSNLSNVVLVNNPVVLNDTSLVINKVNDYEYILENAKANHTYVISITYQYDLNDDLGIKTLTKEYEITTSKQTPTISFSPYNILQNSIEYNLLIQDNNVTGRVNLITLYKGVTFIKRLNNLDTKIDGLESNTTYTIKINYVYDFDDGYGSREINTEYQFTTLKQDLTYNLSITGITKSGFMLNHYLVDPDFISTFKSVDIYLGKTLVKRITSYNEVSVDGLLSDNTYKVVVTFEKDLNTGIQDSSYIYYVTTDKYEKPTIDIYLSSNKTSISYDYILNDPFSIASFVRAEIYYNNAKVMDTSSNIFEGLYSDNIYTVKLLFLCDYHNGNDFVLETFEEKIRTLHVSDITLNINTEAQKTKILYQHSIVDVDNIASIKEVRLYRGNKLIKTNTSLDDKIFDNLYSNTVYRIVYIVEKDYHNNTNNIIVEYEKVVNTKSLEVPKVSIALTSTVDSISYEFDTIDTDDILNLEKLDIYYNKTLIKSITSFTNLISGLDANKKYRLVLTYSYDLNDLQGKVTKEEVKEYYTLVSILEVKNVNLVDAENPKTNQNINVNIELNNPSMAVVSTVTINGIVSPVIGGDGISNVIVSVKTSRESGEMKIVVNKLGYSVNDDLIETLISKNNTLVVNIFSRLDIVEITLVDGSEFNKLYLGKGFVIKIDNPNGYIVKKIVFTRGLDISLENDTLKIIDDNHLFASFLGLYSNKKCDIVSITYMDASGNETTRNYSDTIEVSYTDIEVDSDTNALLVHEVSTPEEFMNMKGCYLYELACDIDMTGYKWEPYIFYGYFNGKGHTIKNLSYIHEDEWKFSGDYDKSLLIFNLFVLAQKSTFKNVFFENLYVDIDSTFVNFDMDYNRDGYINYTGTTSLFMDKYIKEAVRPIFENVLLNGNINIKSNGKFIGGFTLYTDSTYIVNKLTINNTLYNKENIISYDTFNSDSFRVGTLNWKFKDDVVRNYNGFIYKVIDNSYIIITGYNGKNSDVVVPTEIEGLKVVGISDLAFKDNLVIENFTLNNSVYYLGGSILSGCKNIRKITINDNIVPLASLFGSRPYDNSYESYYSYIPKKLKHLVLNGNYKTIISSSHVNYSSLEVFEFSGINHFEVYAFDSSENLKTVYLNGTIDEWCNIYFENRMSNPMHYATNFYCKNSDNEYEIVTEVVLPSSISKVAANVFINFRTLKKVVIPEGVETIEESAFHNCTKIYDLTLPASLRECNAFAFMNCNIQYIYYNGTISDWCNILMEDADSNPSKEYTNFYIKDESNNYKLLTELVIPDNITTINEYSFRCFKSISSITIPSSIKCISYDAFASCTGLVDLKIENGVTFIEQCAFECCYLLSNIWLPKSITYIDSNAFYNCFNVEKLYYDGTIEDWINITFENIESNPMNDGQTIYMKNSQNEYEPVTKIVIPDNISVISEYQFMNFNSIEKLVIPSTVKKIESRAFAFCGNLKEIIIEDGLTDIEDYAFYGCRCEKVYIPLSVTTIGIGAFFANGNIYCEAESKPKGWNNEWGYGDIIWGYTLNQE